MDRAAYRIFFDGCSSVPSPGLGGAGVVILDAAGTLIAEHAYPLDDITSNSAEFMACRYAVLAAIKLDCSDLKLFGDNRLVILTLNNRTVLAAENLQPLARDVRRLLRQIPTWVALWIPRERNAHADRLSRKGKRMAQDANPNRDGGRPIVATVDDRAPRLSRLHDLRLEGTAADRPEAERARPQLRPRSPV